jgi:bifunctional DNase/RNase
MSDRRIEMSVESVRVHPMSTTHVVILKEREADRYLPIWIGPWEANAIAMRLQGVSPERPMTHDLFANAIGELHARIRAIVISDLEEETYHARLVLEAPDERIVEIDARPSDAIALAVRAGAPIYVEAAVLERAGVRPDQEGSTEGDSEPGLEGTPDEEKLSVFRDFINSLDSGPSGGGDDPLGGPRWPDAPPADRG